jgi:starch synthase
MKVLIVSSEATPFAKTGGLADVTGTLVDELRKLKIDSSVIIPFYRRTRRMVKDLGIKELDKGFTVPLGNEMVEGRLWKGKTAKGADAYFIENDRFYDREELYGTGGGDYPDNSSRFIFFSRGVLEAIKALGLGFDIIHCNDWHSALIPVYLNTIYRDELPKTASMLTIHNIGYQGIFWHLDIPLTGLGWDAFRIDALEYYGKINLLKGGILFADIITTVSNTYAKEIMTPDYGAGLDGVLRERSLDLYGVLNGIDYNEWNPWKDRLISAKYNRKSISKKSVCKDTLKEECKLTKGNMPLIGIVSRLAPQKGIELVVSLMEKIIKLGAQMIILGKGEEQLEKELLKLRDKYRGNLFVKIGFDDILAHKIYAGTDIFLMPSRYEPCGLGQLIAMGYGTIPVVRKTGGLADTVTAYSPDTGEGTGFLFDEYSAQAMLASLKHAIEVYNNKEEWHRIMFNAMSKRFTWRESARKYSALYKKAINKCRDRGS